MPTRDFQEDGTPTIRSDPSSSDTTAPIKEGRYTAAVFKDRYQIERRLGAGGIGEVYLARDQQLHSKPVVVKVLLEESGRDEWFKKKFRQEIEALARIDHPGVVGVLDAGDTPDGKPFLVMQYVKGHDLRSMIKNEGMSFDQTATIIRQAGQAMSAAHDQRVLHCDLKPENIMLQDLGEGEYQVKIVDFGIAKIKDSQVRTGSHETKVAGTVSYMAPEQIQGNPSAASDVFALGVIACEMLTGRRPFNPPSAYHMIEAVRAGVRIKLKDLRPDLSAEAQEIILKALSFDERERYERARDFGELLAQALTTDLELPTQNQSEGADIEMAHVLFMDLVGYSKLATDEQTRLVKQLQHIVSNAETFQRAKAGRQLISRSTGDGMALVFFSNPKAPVECSVEIARAIRQYPYIHLRMGINSGPVYRVKDMNETVDVAGAGINMAQRVMDCGDEGHILLSKSVADVLGELGEWRSRIHDLGVCKVKHGVTVHIYNLCFEESGNARTPEKMGKKRKPLVAAIAIGLVVLLAAAITVWIVYGGKTLDTASTSNANTGGVKSSEIERMLSFSLKVQKFRNGKPDGKEFSLPDASIIFEEYYQIKLDISTPQAGYFYVLNETPDKENGSPRYIVLYPSNADKQQGETARITVPEPTDEWLEFNDERGTEKLWLVWSDQAVDEMESVKSLANEARGEIKDPDRNNTIQQMLAKYSASKPVAERDEANKQTNVKGKGKVLVYALNLEHQ